MLQPGNLIDLRVCSSCWKLKNPAVLSVSGCLCTSCAKKSQRKDVQEALQEFLKNTSKDRQKLLKEKITVAVYELFVDGFQGTDKEVFLKLSIKNISFDYFSEILLQLLQSKKIAVQDGVYLHPVLLYKQRHDTYHVNSLKKFLRDNYELSLEETLEALAAFEVKTVKTRNVA